MIAACTVVCVPPLAATVYLGVQLVTLPRPAVGFQLSTVGEVTLPACDRYLSTVKPAASVDVSSGRVAVPVIAPSATSVSVESSGTQPNCGREQCGGQDPWLQRCHLLSPCSCAAVFAGVCKGGNAGTLPDKSVSCDTYLRGEVDLRSGGLLSGATAHVVRASNGRGRAGLARRGFRTRPADATRSTLLGEAANERGERVVAVLQPQREFAGRVGADHAPLGLQRR